jgi:peptide-methionine (R)-S-oxide reductase
MSDHLPGSSQTYPVTRTDAEWQVFLTPEQHAVLRRRATEHPGTSPLLAEHRDGTFVCAGCGQPLFSSGTKYESGSGWPSFFAAVEGAIGTREDRSLGMTRVEIHCSRCGGHLGHVFSDGPRPTGQRYCTNGAALKFNVKE